MDQTKPQRRTNIFDYWNSHKKIKVIDESTSSSRKVITRFEDIPNELFYEVFTYLDVYHVYQAFYSLNLRLQNLLTNSTLPLKINISSMSKATFQRYHRHIIIPNKHRIISMQLSNPLVVDLIFSPVRITSSFTRLETLSLDHIKSKYLLNILHYLAALPKLSSLIIIPIDRCSNRNDLYQNVFRLPTLKYCKMSLIDRFESISLSISSSITSPIERLIIDNPIYLHQLNALLSYVPQLHRLTCTSLDVNYSQQSDASSVVLNRLTHVSLNTIHTTFDRLEAIIRSLFRHLQVLHFYASNDREYLNATRWKYLISTYMSHLRVFDFQYRSDVEGDAAANRTVYNSVLGHFSSPFWSERKWFFGYQLHSEVYKNQVVFYSRSPHRRKQHTLYKPMIDNVRSHRQRDNMNAVNHLEIRGDIAMFSCGNSFRNVTQLTLSNSFDRNRVRLGFNLTRFVSCHQLTTLVIECDDFNLEQLIDILRSMRHIRTLTCNCQSINETQSKLVQQSDMFRFVSSTNKIRNVTITERYSSENIKLLLALCPRIEHLTIDAFGHYLDSIVELILSKSKTDLQYLCLLCLKNTAKSTIGRLKDRIESEELLDNYLMKHIGSDIYFWW